MTIQWHEILNSHTHRAAVGDVLRLFVDPDISGGVIRYHATVYDLNLSLIRSTRGLPDVATAQKECLQLAAAILHETLAAVRSELAQLH